MTGHTRSSSPGSSPVLGQFLLGVQFSARRFDPALGLGAVVRPPVRPDRVLQVLAVAIGNPSIGERLALSGQLATFGGVEFAMTFTSSHLARGVPAAAGVVQVVGHRRVVAAVVAAELLTLGGLARAACVHTVHGPPSLSAPRGSIPAASGRPSPMRSSRKHRRLALSCAHRGCPSPAPGRTGVRIRRRCDAGARPARRRAGRVCPPRAGSRDGQASPRARRPASRRRGV